jgi:trehalose 6-phosphate phosphatase
MESAGGAAMRRALAPLLADPGRAAVLLDVDGTLAPIAPTAEEAAVPEPTRLLLQALAGRYGLVACVSGRRALEARELVGVEMITYIGNHGLEQLRPGSEEPEVAPAVAEHARTARDFARSRAAGELTDLGIRLEDKGSIWSFHWRGAPDEAAACAALEAVAADAEQAGLVPHWGRKVLEVRPPLKIDKGVAVAELLRRASLDSALYAGDDTTDLDAFRGLRKLKADGALRNAVCVGVRSAEGPAALADEADVLVDGPQGIVELLELLATATAPNAVH